MFSPHVRSSSTPHHPPYAYMIRRAIEALGEEGGSTARSISDYIKAEFGGLPSAHAHDRLLAFYLNDLIKREEFAVGGAPDRYVVVGDPPSTPVPSVRHSSPESVIKCAIEILKEEGGSTQESICRCILANFGELPWAPSKYLFFFVNRLTERGELVAGAGPGRYVLAPPPSGPKGAAGEGGPNKAAEEGGPSMPRSEPNERAGGDAVPAPKRRGRPPKARSSEPKDRADGKGKGKGGGGGDAVSAPKRRGRAPKTRRNVRASSQSGPAQEVRGAPGPTQPVGPPPTPKVELNEYVLALPAPESKRRQRRTG